MSISGYKKATIIVDSQIAEMISKIQHGTTPNVDMIPIEVQGILRNKNCDIVKLDHLVLAGSPEAGFIGYITDFEDGFTEQHYLEGVPIQYGHNNHRIGTYARSYDKDNMLVVAVNNETADVWEKVLSEDRAGQRYSVKSLV